MDLARGTLTVRAAKTDAGIRAVNILPVLHDELGDYRARIDPPDDALVFGTATGRRQGATNIRRRVLAKAIKHANTTLVKDGDEPLPDNLTPHSLRRTYASILFALGESPPYVMAQMGHTTANLTLAIYARQMDRRDGEPERLKVLVEGRLLPNGGASHRLASDGRLVQPAAQVEGDSARHASILRRNGCANQQPPL